MNDFVIEKEQLTKIYGKQTVVSKVDLHVKKGTIYGLLGRNGAGKTTIMKIILGLTHITFGEIDVVQNEHTLWIYDTTLNIGEISRTLVMQNVTVISSLLCNDSLGDYFKK